MNAERANPNTLNTQRATVKLAKMGIIVAIAVVLVWLVHFPFPFAPTFLEYDPADVPIIIGTFAFGPIAGLLLTVLTAVIQGVTVSAASGLYGILMHIAATGTFVLVSGLIYRKEKTRVRAIVALLCGVVAMTAIMVPANIIITPIFMGVPKEAVIGLLPAIIAFNVTKAGINAAITFLIYKRISNFLHK